MNLQILVKVWPQSCAQVKPNKNIWATPFASTSDQIEGMSLTLTPPPAPLLQPDIERRKRVAAQRGNRQVERVGAVG